MSPDDFERGGSQDWRSFPLSRLTGYERRTLGSLTSEEFERLRSTLLPKIRDNWEKCDEGIRNLHKFLIHVIMLYDSIITYHDSVIWKQRSCLVSGREN